MSGGICMELSDGLLPACNHSLRRSGKLPSHRQILAHKIPGMELVILGGLRWED